MALDAQVPDVGHRPRRSRQRPKGRRLTDAAVDAAADILIEWCKAHPEEAERECEAIRARKSKRGGN